MKNVKGNSLIKKLALAAFVGVALLSSTEAYACVRVNLVQSPYQANYTVTDSSYSDEKWYIGPCNCGVGLRANIYLTSSSIADYTVQLVSSKSRADRILCTQ